MLSAIDQIKQILHGVEDLDELVKIRQIANARVQNVRARVATWPEEDDEQLVFLWTKTARTLHKIAEDMERRPTQIMGRLNFLNQKGTKLFPREEVCTAQLSLRQVTCARRGDRKRK